MEESTFPSDKFDALAMLYVQRQDLSGLTPEELLNLYEDARKKMRDQSKLNSKPQSVGY